MVRVMVKVYANKLKADCCTIDVWKTMKMSTGSWRRRWEEASWRYLSPLVSPGSYVIDFTDFSHLEYNCT